jgi:hypothetical protein
METIEKVDQKILAVELANAITSFNIEEVTKLLSDYGEYCIEDENEEIVISNKMNFINWLGKCFDEFLFVNEQRTQLNYIMDQCLHCKIGNPVIILENGRFPVFTRNSWEREKCGLMLEFDDNLVSGITFCFVFLHTDNPYLFEKGCTRHLNKT